ncbi:tRNA (N6-threonylcarbamoyladenosine(37)-N6)-methyltransferase TrmO [Mariniphaga sediminis]|uniref:tRNA (N6-threonylcarbamoyladenosine(37)-N6)-methyltransferase TrmO n=1 Tax=Mariniphaga sediminis TaxID=1628158 RepID=UPI0035645C4C
MKDITFHPVGVIHSSFKKTERMPIQPAAAAGSKGRIEIFREYADGLKDIEGFSHIILLYHFHQAAGFRLEVKPFLDEKYHGVFATRAPQRPNPIGLSIVKLVGRTGNILEIENVDILDGTPLLDIKPFVPEFDAIGEISIGWLANSKRKIIHSVSDGRFNSNFKTEDDDKPEI